MLAATCHCGSIRIEVPRRPRSLTNCNCSICRRYGTLWAYYQRAEVQITVEAGAATDDYAWGDKSLRFVRCSRCGCVTHWEPLELEQGSRTGINMRNFEPEVLGPVRIRLLDGASTWKYLG
jgi:hypothetical protein